MNKVILSIFMATLFISCHTRKKVTTAEPKVSATEVSSPTPPTTPIPPTTPPMTPFAINDGAVLYKNNCGLCHELYEPTAFSVKKWEHEVPEMVIKANTEKNARLSKEQEQKILAYVTSMSVKK